MRLRAAVAFWAATAARLAAASTAPSRWRHAIDATVVWPSDGARAAR